MKNKEFISDKLNINTFENYLNFPMYYEIETINACNAKCEMCTIADWEKHPDPFMSKSLFKKIADELISKKDIVRVVNLCRDGEPLMDKGLEEKIDYLKNAGIKHTTFSTNASLLNKERALSLINSQLDEIMFSVDGFKKETFEAIRVGLKFEKVVDNIKQFIHLRDEYNSKIKIRVRLVIQDKNILEVEDWKNFWRPLLGADDSVHAKAIHSWGNQLDNFSAAKEFQAITTPCTSTFSTMIIRYNGDVTICPLDYSFKYKNGNLNGKSIEYIWQNGDEFKRFRQIHLDGERDDFPFCKGCRLWDSENKDVY